MAPRFDESLPALAHVVSEELGTEILTAGVVLRDTTGRLAFFANTPLKQTTIDRVSRTLRSALGPYARSDRILVSSDEFGASEIFNEPSIQNVTVDNHVLRLVDRRLAGADWLRQPSAAAPPPPRFVFASLKGGVGRSTALSVAAAHFASQGRRVLAVDLDMEAPGLGAMLLDEDTVPEFGLIDALVESGLSPLDDKFLADLVGPSALADRRGRIDVIPAFGRRSLDNPGDVLAKIARAYAEHIEDGKVTTILDQVRALVDRFSEGRGYDAILVDSRAGLHETTAAAVLGLGAEVFLFGLNEPQTFQGYAALLAHLSRFIPPAGTIPEWVERITMVQGRASTAESQAEFVDKCRLLFARTGLTARTVAADKDAAVPLPADPFGDVPWDDSTQDDELELEGDSNLNDPVAISEDERFRLFHPAVQHDLLSEQVYRPSYGAFLDRMSKAFPSSGETQS